MIRFDIPGFGRADIDHVVFDYNGTIALDGALIKGVAGQIQAWSGKVKFHVITADTFGFVEKELTGMDVTLKIISKDRQDEKKLSYLNTLGPDSTLCVGNGMNDRLMLKSARIGIAILGEEGLAASCLAASDLVLKNILDLFDFFKTPDRLVATLRS